MVEQGLWRALLHYSALEQDRYLAPDIEAMRAIDKKLPAWNYQAGELALWHLDQAINDRGVMVDTDLAHAAIRAVERAQKVLAHRTNELTDGAVQAATQRDAMLREINYRAGQTARDLAIKTNNFSALVPAGMMGSEAA